jgi:hypothetical protein
LTGSVGRSIVGLDLEKSGSSAKSLVTQTANFDGGKRETQAYARKREVQRKLVAALDELLNVGVPS